MSLFRSASIGRPVALAARQRPREPRFTLGMERKIARQSIVVFTGLVMASCGGSGGPPAQWLLLTQVEIGDDRGDVADVLGTAGEAASTEDYDDCWSYELIAQPSDTEPAGIAFVCFGGVLNQDVVAVVLSDVDECSLPRPPAARGGWVELVGAFCP